ncbi:MAG: Mrp/NBP35 family ATP-binding protein [Ignavibacteriaceae bacterium]
MIQLTKSELLKLLKEANLPALNSKLLTLNNIKKLNTEDGTAEIELSLPINREEITEKLKNVLVEKLRQALPEVKNIRLNISGKGIAVTKHEDAKKDALLPGVKNTIAVASGKGGVGKSTVAVNLAVALASEGAKVGLIDADIYGPSVPLMLGIQEKPKVLKEGESVKMIPPESYGVKAISIGFLVDDNAPVIWRGPMASGAVKQFMSDVKWDELDYLIFDLPPGTGDIQLTLVQTIPLTGAVIVTTPQEVSLIDARKALKMFNRVNVPVLGLIENMSYFIAPDTGKKYDIFGTGGGSKVARELNVPFLGGIPIEPRIRIGGDNGVPVIYEMPDSDQSDIIIRIANNLIEQVNLRNRNGKQKVKISLGDNDQ